MSIRLAAVPVTLITGRPYGIYRDKLFQRFGHRPVRPLESLLIDSFANAAFQVPLHVGLLAWGGASSHQMLVAATTILVVASISGRPYGVFLRCCRLLFGASPLP